MSFLLLALAMAADPAPSAPVAASPVPLTPQQQFDAASTAATDGRCAQAVPLFAALEPTVKPDSIVAAAIAVRKGTCLVKLGQAEEGEKAIRAGLPRMAAAGEGFAIETSESWAILGAVAEQRLDYGAAFVAYRSALALRTGIGRLQSLGRLAMITAFEPGATSLDYAAEGIKLLEADKTPNKDQLAAFHAIHARTLLNLGRAQEAYDELKLALKLSGGLTTRTSLAEAELRGDLATAALLTGKRDDARLYLAYTGAGRLEKSPFSSPQVMMPPPCGGPADLSPDQMAIVEFTITDEGEVSNARTVYSGAGTQAALAFAAAVRHWRWLPADAAAIPAFYRMTTRVELRCSQGVGAGQNFEQPLKRRFIAWAAPQLPQDGMTPFSFGLGERLHSLATGYANAGDVPRRVAALGLVALHSVDHAEQSAATDEALAAAAAAPGTVPTDIVNALRYFRFASGVAETYRGGGELPASVRAQVLAMTQEPGMVGDATAVDTLRLFPVMLTRGRTILTDQMASSVADDERLPVTSPLRQTALLLLANLAAAKHDPTGARNYMARTGLTEQQCALVGVKPALRNFMSGDSYPREALIMGFEGWVQLEFDINADGTTAHARPVIAYPPMVFVDTATNMAHSLRYEASYRPNGSPACSAQTDKIRFVIPR